MQALKCDICGQSLQGTAFEFTTVRGEAVPSFDGGIAITHRQSARLLQLCGTCGRWIRLGMQTVKESFEAAEQMKHDVRWLNVG